ncbi:hypothetical protein AB3X52_04005 [Nocardioides sp. DS6]|uniref:DUF559 domain-containing protein n=1 Tax=Nocardioides eburneus TaxID=3231482 RepID=A0ABV3SV07_9ACTN
MASRRPHFQPPAYSAERPGLVRPVRVDPTGEAGPTPRQARGRAWRSTSRGLYVPSSVDGDLPQQRVLEAATVLPDYAAVTGWAAFAWKGARWFDGFDPRGEPRPVPLAVLNHQVRTRPGLLICAERLRPDELYLHDGLRVTDPTRSVAFEMRYAADVRAAAACLDMAAYSDLVSIAGVARLAERLNGWTGIGQLRTAVGLADENSWSPAESDMRMTLRLDLGLTGLLCNHPVFDLDGRHLGTPDVIDPEAGVAWEYDGPLHLEGRQRAKDLRREAVFRRVGLEYVTMVGADRVDPGAFLQRSVDARRRAQRLPGPRQWTVEPPSWWTPTTTVAQRLALTDAQRQRFLRNRAA